MTQPRQPSGFQFGTWKPGVSCAILNPDFTCDICGLPGIKAAANQKRHTKCAEEKKRRTSARLWKKRRERT